MLDLPWSHGEPGRMLHVERFGVERIVIEPHGIEHRRRPAPGVAMYEHPPVVKQAYGEGWIVVLVSRTARRPAIVGPAHVIQAREQSGDIAHTPLPKGKRMVNLRVGMARYPP